MCQYLFAVGLLPPQNIHISDEWYTRFRVSWDPSPSPVLGYKIVYKPVGKKTALSSFNAQGSILSMRIFFVPFPMVRFY